MTLTEWFTVGCLYCVLDMFIGYFILKHRISLEAKDFIRDYPIIFLVALSCLIMCWPILVIKLIRELLEKIK